MNEGDRILRKNSIDYLRNKTNNPKYQNWHIPDFYKGNVKELRAIMSELDSGERAFLFSIAPYIGYEDCCIRYDNGKELSTKQIQDLVGMGQSKVYAIIKSLQEKDILYKGKNSKNTQYFVNPYLFCKGTRINKVLQKMFDNYQVRIKII